MIKQFQALPISWRHAREAYPLVYLHDASISLADWLRFARRRDRNPSEQGALIAVRDCRGIIHALFSYRIDVDLRIRRRLCISDLIVAHLPGVLIEEAISASVNQIAGHLHCQTISIERPFGHGVLPGHGCPTARLLDKRQRLIPDRRPN